LKYIELLSVAQQRAAQRMCERHFNLRVQSINFGPLRPLGNSLPRWATCPPSPGLAPPLDTCCFRSASLLLSSC